MASTGWGYVRRNHLGLIAIFIALGGTAYAANKVGSSDIAKNAVRSKHIKAKQVKPGDVSPKLRDGCPRGTVLLSELCVKPADGSNRDFIAAFDFCADGGLRLPSQPEAHLISSQNNVPGIAPGELYWTDEVVDGNLVALANEDQGYGAGSAQGTPWDVICVTEPREGG